MLFDKMIKICKLKTLILITFQTSETRCKNITKNFHISSTPIHQLLNFVLFASSFEGYVIKPNFLKIQG
jgi:hypothetical protein